MNPDTAPSARILIVEDDAGAAHLLRELLGLEGHEVVGIAADGATALRLAASARPDLVLMNIVLPGGMDGIETATRLAQQQDLPVLYLTGHTEDEALFARARASAPVGYLSKPFDDQGLRRAVELALDRHALVLRLRQSEARLAEAQAVAQIGSWCWHLEEDRIELSDELLRLLDLSRDGFNPCSDAFLSMAHPDDRPALQAAMQALLGGGDPGELDVRLACADGTERVLRLRGALRRDNMGHTVALIGTARNVTEEWRLKRAAESYQEHLEQAVAARTAELSAANARLQGEIEQRRRVEEMLWQSEEHYRDLVEHLPAPLLVIQDQQIVFANPALARLLGLPAAGAALGLAIGRVLHPDSHAACAAAIQACLAGGTAVEPVHIRLLDQTGQNIEAEALPLPFDFGGRQAVLAVLRDRTAQRTAERAAERFRLALDSSPDEICLIDPQTMRILDVNATACASLGYSREELLCQDLHNIKPDFDAGALRLRFTHLVAGLPGADILRTRHRRRDGSTFPVELRLRAFRCAGQDLVVAVARDISEQVRREAELHETGERFRQLAQSIDEAIWIRDLAANRFIYASPAYERLYGQSVASLFHDPRAFLARIHPQDRLRVAKAFRQMRSRPEPMELEYRVVVNGHERWLWVRTFPIFDTRGRVYRRLGLAKDMTERRQAEERYQSILQTAMDGFWITDAQGRLLECNDTICHMLGYRREELLALSVGDFEALESPEETREHTRRIIGRGTDRFETRHRRKDGREIDVEVSVQHLEGAEGGRFIAFLRDIGARKQAERTLVESEERYRAVVEDQTEVITRLAADGTVLFANDVYCRFFGKGADTVVGSHWRPAVHPDDVPMIEARLATLTPSKPVVLIENRVFSGQGKLHWMQFVNRAFFDAAGHIREIQSVGRDITDRKLAELALKAAENFKRAVLDAVNTQVAVLDRNGTIIDVNAAWRDFATENARVPGKPVLHAGVGTNYLRVCDTARGSSSEGADAVAQGIRAVLAGDLHAFSHEYPCHAPEQQRWFQLTVTPLRGEAGGVVVSHSNITAPRLLAEELRRSEARTRSILRAAPVGIGVVVERVFQEVNEAMTRITGYAEEELIGRSARMLYPTQAEFDQAGSEKYRQIREQGIGSVETRWQRKDGAVIDVALRSSPIVLDDPGKGVAFTALDITRTKRAEQERLAHEAAQRNALVREVHHRIKNNLQGVIGLLRQHMAEHPGTRAVMESAIAQINTIAVVHGLQGRMQQGELRLRELLVEVATAAASLALLPHRPPLEDTLEGEIWLENGTAVSIALILNELIHNAIKHGRPGAGPSITLSGRDGLARVRIVNGGGPLPAGFDLATGRGCGTGMDLVRTLLPRRGATLSLTEADGRVVTELSLAPPLTTATAALSSSP